MNSESQKWSKDQLTKEQAIKMYESDVWQTWSSEQVVRFQLFQKRLCMPFSNFHRCIEEVFGRPVFTHEFGNRDEMIKEYLGEKDMPTIDEIINLIPAEKRIVIGV